MVSLRTSATPHSKAEARQRDVYPRHRFASRLGRHQVLAALVNLNKRPYYFHWGVIELSAANLIVIVMMLLVFVAAILIPFPKDKGR